MNFFSFVKILVKEDVDEIIVRFFFVDGLNINIVNLFYFREMVRVIVVFGFGYEFFFKDMLFDFFLSKEKVKLEKVIILIRDFWLYIGCLIICINRLDSLFGCFCINMFILSFRGIMFLKLIDINEGDGVDNLFVNVFSDVIIEVGLVNVF